MPSCHKKVNTDEVAEPWKEGYVPAYVQEISSGGRYRSCLSVSLSSPSSFRLCSLASRETDFLAAFRFLSKKECSWSWNLLVAMEWAAKSQGTWTIASFSSWGEKTGMVVKQSFLEKCVSEGDLDQYRLEGAEGWQRQSVLQEMQRGIIAKRGGRKAQIRPKTYFLYDCFKLWDAFGFFSFIFQHKIAF